MGGRNEIGAEHLAGKNPRGSIETLTGQTFFDAVLGVKQAKG